MCVVFLSTSIIEDLELPVTLGGSTYIKLMLTKLLMNV